MKKKVFAFFEEIWFRLGLPSPTVAIVLQWISGAVVFVSGLPQLLLAYQTQLQAVFPTLVFPAWMFSFSSKAAFIAGIIGFFLSKIPIKKTAVALALKKNGDTKLPFTQKNTTPPTQS